MHNSEKGNDAQRSINIFQAVQHMAKIGGWEIDLIKNTLFWTEETYLIHDTTAAEFTPTVDNAVNFYTPKWRAAINLALSNAIEKGTGFDLELELVTAKGRKIWVHIYGKVIMQHGLATKVLGALQDISEKKQAEQEIWHKGHFDFLTGLPNRRMFQHCLTEKIAKASQNQTKVALLYIDLDNFREVNDSFGHNWGDTLLKHAAKRLRSCIRNEDAMARLGGDEFTIIIGDLDDCGMLKSIADDILTAMSEPFQIETEIAYITASIGITLYPDNATEPDKLLKNADQARYVAKAKGRNGFQFYTTAMQKAAETRGVIVKNLQTALANSEFRVVYQPIVSLTTGAIHKAEALIRWHHPSLGLISPADFIHIAEETGMIIDIGEWVFQQAAQQTKQWRDLYQQEIQISVNTSPVQYHDRANKLSQWLNYLYSLGLDGNAIVAEITEGVLMGTNSEITDKLRGFRQDNIQISLDDFGTGYSSLSYLRKFEIDYIKIDQSFVRNLKSDSKDLGLCEAIIAMAHKLDLQVIAEGIETDEQNNLLMAAGCDFGQGYFFSKPVPAADFEQLFSSSHRVSNNFSTSCSAIG
ncbi:MAG: EAL domain-containing protein [Pseudomonadales bacterium]|nr:EAL domain-containing protein [Pseudomonadales bacterium]